MSDVWGMRSDTDHRNLSTEHTEDTDFFLVATLDVLEEIFYEMLLRKKSLEEIFYKNMAYGQKYIQFHYNL